MNTTTTDEHKPRLLPVHKTIEIGIPPRLTLECAPTKLSGVVAFMVRQRQASDKWAQVTCPECRKSIGDERGRF